MLYKEKIRIVDRLFVAENRFILKLEGDLEFRPGQFYNISIPNKDYLGFRSYNPFKIGNETYFYVRLFKQGKISPLLASMEVPYEILLSGPFGRGWVVKEDKATLIGVSNGISSMISLAQELNREGIDYILYYLEPDGKFAFRDLLEKEVNIVFVEDPLRIRDISGEIFIAGFREEVFRVVSALKLELSRVKLQLF